MAKCRWCDRTGWFLSVDARGLCNNCIPLVGIEVGSRVRVIAESAKLVQESKKIDTKLSRCDLIIDNAEALKKFEDHGIPVMEMPPSQVAMQFREIRVENQRRFGRRIELP